MKKKRKISLKIQMLHASLLPLLALFILLLFVSYNSFYSTISKQTEADMINQCQLAKNMFDKLYPGEYAIEVINDSSYKLTKGSYDITNEQGLLDDLKAAFGDDVSIYCMDYTVLTTMVDEDGNSRVLSGIASTVKKDVLDTGSAKFYNKVTIDDESFMAYFEPIIWEDGTVFGMYAIYRPSADIVNNIWHSLLPIAIVYLIASIIIGSIVILYSQSIAERIAVLDKFMNNLSNGKFDGDIPQKYMSREDEITDLARSGKIMQKSLRNLVELDALTNINNRRSGNIALSNALKKAEVNGINYCISIGDIDFFKKVNDTYGHDAGDAVLVAVADVLKKKMVGSGFVARWGGEEFLFIFEMMTLDQAADKLGEILDEIRALEIKSNDDTIKVTMSFGVAEHSDDDESTDALLKKADGRLYIAKATGRNQVIKQD